ncbi:AgmX/PglI C-terminal domain-containing protein [Myxococcota bacterium]
MRFACKKCQTKYTIADERIRGKAIKFRCKRCNTVLTVKAPPAPVLLDKPKQEWFYGLDGDEKGPVSLVKLQSMLISGEVSAECFVWKKGSGDWIPVEEMPELAPAMRQAAAARKQADKSKKALEHEREAAIRSRKQAEEKKRREAEEAQRQEELYRKRREERAKKAKAEKDTGRQELVQRVLNKRQKVRADRHADRIAGHFFDDLGEGTGEDDILPPPPGSQAELLADQLDRESVQEERGDIGSHPLGVIEEQGPVGLDGRETSKVSKILVAQAGMGAAWKGRKLIVTLASVVGVLAVLGGGVYLAASQGWFGAMGASGKEKSTRGRSKIVDPTGELSKKEAKRLRDSLWTVERKSSGGRRIGLPGFDLQVPRETTKKLSEKEKKLQAFYQKQGKEKHERAPRIPDSALLPTPTTVDLPTAPVGSIDAPLLTKKSEVTPTGPERASGPERLSDFQVRVVIQKHYQQVKSCLERQLKRDASISGKMYVVARVSPNGKVEKVHIATPKFNGTFVEECLVKEVKRWEFPSFRGETYDLVFPLLLTARQTY